MKLAIFLKKFKIAFFKKGTKAKACSPWATCLLILVHFICY